MAQINPIINVFPSFFLFSFFCICCVYCVCYEVDVPFWFIFTYESEFEVRSIIIFLLLPESFSTENIFYFNVHSIISRWEKYGDEKCVFRAVCAVCAQFNWTSMASLSRPVRQVDTSCLNLFVKSCFLLIESWEHSTLSSMHACWCCVLVSHCHHVMPFVENERESERRVKENVTWNFQT